MILNGKYTLEYISRKSVIILNVRHPLPSMENSPLKNEFSESYIQLSMKNKSLIVFPEN
jgi:hypothetical protein